MISLSSADPEIIQGYDGYMFETMPSPVKWDGGNIARFNSPHRPQILTWPLIPFPEGSPFPGFFMSIMDLLRDQMILVMLGTSVQDTEH
jgi:hypothetical protein